MGRCDALLPFTASLSRDVPIYRLVIPEYDAAETQACWLALAATVTAASAP